MSISRSLVVEARGSMVLRNLTLPQMPNDYILVKTKAGELMSAPISSDLPKKVCPSGLESH